MKWPQIPNARKALDVGAPAVIHGFAGPQVNVTCGCPAKTPLLLFGFGHVAQCPACRRGRTISRFSAVAGQDANIEVVDVAVPEGGFQNAVK